MPLSKSSKLLPPRTGTIKFEVITAIARIKEDVFSIQDVVNILPKVKRNTIQTFITRDFKALGLIASHDRNQKPYLYIKCKKLKDIADDYIKEANKNKETIRKSSEIDSYGNIQEIEKSSNRNKTPKHGSYSSIGKAIEKLINEKNAYISALEEDNQEYNDLVKSLEETIQSHERHIREQSIKIHELNEKLRNQSGGSIKLDELQNIIKRG
jgi:hypothetical protein